MMVFSSSQQTDLSCWSGPLPSITSILPDLCVCVCLHLCVCMCVCTSEGKSWVYACMIMSAPGYLWVCVYNYVCVRMSLCVRMSVCEVRMLLMPFSCCKRLNDGLLNFIRDRLVKGQGHLPVSQAYCLTHLQGPNNMCRNPLECCFHLHIHLGKDA